MKKSAKIIAAATLSSVLLTGCNTAEPVLKEKMPPAAVNPSDSDDIESNVMGIMPAIDETDDSFVTVDPPEPEEETDLILMGDVAYVPDEE